MNARIASVVSRVSVFTLIPKRISKCTRKSSHAVLVGSIALVAPPSQQAVSAHSGDDPRQEEKVGAADF